MATLNSKAALPVGVVAPTQTWAWVAANSGSYAGQRIMVPAADGLGGWVSLTWNATVGKWDPSGDETLASYPIVTGNSSTTSTLVIPTTTLTGGPHWVNTRLEIVLRLTGTVNGCTAAPVNLALGAMSLIADTQATMRRKAFQRIVDITAAAAQYAHAKTDNNYSSYSNENAAGLTGSVNTAADFTVTADVSTGWVNASTHVLSMQELTIRWRR